MTRQTGLLFLLVALLLITPASAQTETEGTTFSSVYGLLLLGLLGLSCTLAWRLRQHKRSYIGLLNSLDTAGLALLSLDSERQITHLNSHFLALGGVSDSAQSLRDLPADWRVWLDKHVQQALEHGNSVAEERVFTPDENRPAMLLRLSAARMNNARGQAGVLLWCENISASNEMVSTALEREHTLRTRSQSFIQTLIDVIPRPVYVKNASGCYILANEAFCTGCGIPRSHVIGHTAAELGIDATQAQATALEDARVMAGAPIFKEEFSASPNKAGEDRFTIVSKQSCLNPEGHRVLVGTHIDITPWRIAERELHAAVKREQERHLRTQLFVQRLLDVFPNPVCLKDAQSRYVMVNEAFALSRGKSREELLNQNALQVAQAVVTQQSGLMTEAEQRALLSQREDLDVLAGTPLRKEENNVKDQNGVMHDRIVTKTACEDPDGRMLILVSLFDITEIRTAQRETSNALEAETARRQRTQAFIQRLIDVIPQPVYIKNLEGTPLMCNSAFITDRGLPREEMLGKTHAQTIEKALRGHPELSDEIRAHAKLSREEDQIVIAGTPLIKEVSRTHPFTGKHIDRIISKAACADQDGEQVIVVAQFDITDLRTAQREATAAMLAEKAHRERTVAFIQRLIDVMPSPVYVRNTEGWFLFINEAFVKDRGKAREAILTNRAWVPGHEIETRVRAEDAKVVAGEIVYKEEFSSHFDTGKDRFRIISKRACEDPDGSMVIVGTNFDITPWRMAERELQQTLEGVQAFTQRLLDVIPEPVYVKDAQARYIMINEAFAAQRKQTPAEILGKSARELAPSQVIAEQVLAEDAEVLAGLVIHKIDPTPHPQTGQPRWRIITKGSCLDPKGQPVIVGASFDITAVRVVEQQLHAALKAEQDLRERTQHFIQRLIDALPLPVCVRDRDSRHLHVNARFLSNAGLTREQIIDRRITDFISDPEQIATSLREDHEVLAGHDIFEEKQDLGLTGKDLRDLIISKRSCIDVDGQPVIVVTHIDVTAQREAERHALSLMANERSLRQRTQDFIQRLIDIIPHPFFVKDQESRYILINTALTEEFQRPASEILGHTTLELAADPAHAQQIMKEDQSVLSGVTVNDERHELAVTGGDHWADRIVSKRRCLDVDGRPVIAASHLDVSAFRDVQRQLEAAMRRESMQVERMREFLQRVIDVIPQEFYIKDADGRILMVNPVYLRRRELHSAAEAIERTAPEIGDDFLTKDPLLRDNPEALEQARLELRKSWEVARTEDLEVLAGKKVLKEVTRRQLGNDTPRTVVIAKAACTDITGRQVIVCASYDITDLRDTMQKLNDLMN